MNKQSIGSQSAVNRQSISSQGVANKQSICSQCLRLQLLLEFLHDLLVCLAVVLPQLCLELFLAPLELLNHIRAVKADLILAVRGTELKQSALM